MERLMADQQEKLHNPIGGIALFIILFLIIFKGFNWYVEHKVLQDAIDKSNFLDSNNATWAEKCNAYLAVKIISTDQNKQDIYQEYQKKYDDNKCDFTKKYD